MGIVTNNVFRQRSRVNTNLHPKRTLKALASKGVLGRASPVNVLDIFAVKLLHSVRILTGFLLVKSFFNENLFIHENS